MQLKAPIHYKKFHSRKSLDTQMNIMVRFRRATLIQELILVSSTHSGWFHKYLHQFLYPFCSGHNVWPLPLKFGTDIRFCVARINYLAKRIQLWTIIKCRVFDSRSSRICSLGKFLLYFFNGIAKPTCDCLAHYWCKIKIKNIRQDKEYCDLL